MKELILIAGAIIIAKEYLKLLIRRRKIMEAQEINQEVNLLIDEVRKLAAKDFKRILEKKLSIEE